MVLNRNVLLPAAVFCILSTTACWSNIWFVNSAFNAYYSLLVGSLLLCPFAISRRKQNGSLVSPVWVSCGIYAVYVILHGFVFEKENYYWMGTLAAFLLLSAMHQPLRNTSDRSFLLNLILWLSIAECFVCLLQWIGVVKSLSPYFISTGTFENPNYSAIIVAFCFPIVIERICNGKHIVPYCLVGILFLLSLAVLLCRTAILIVFVCLLIKLYLWGRNKLGSRNKIAFGILALIFCIGVLTGLYKAKEKSSEGRIFIARQTINLVAEKSAWGVGYGLFEKEFNLYQSEIIQSGKCTSEERKNIRWVFTAYNEFLEQLAQGGIAGLSFFLLFAGSFCLVAFRSHSYISVCFALSIVIEMFFNFWQQAYPIFTVSLLMIGYIMAEDKKGIQMSGKAIILRYFLIWVSVILVGCHTLATLPGQVRLASLGKTSNNAVLQETVEKLEALKPYIGTSSNYYTMLGYSYLRQRKQAKAKAVFLDAGHFTSAPDIYLGLYYCYKLEKDEVKAEECKKYLESIHAK